MPNPLYRTLIQTAIALAPLAGRNPKIREGVAVRRGAVRRYQDWAAAQRDPTRPLLWMHAASVGEARQAEAVLQVLRPAHPEWQIAVSYFSPSASGLGWNRLADFVDCLPWDRPGDTGAALEALTPDALVFCKLDLWPELAGQAARRGVATGMIAGTVSPRATRLRWPMRPLLASGYGSLRRVGAIGAEDAARLVRLGVARDRIELTGDPRFDSALSRASAVAPDEPLRRHARSGPTLVAGSTWPADEAALLAAYRSVRRIRPDAGLILVPHEPREEALARVEQAAREAGLPNPQRLSQLGSTEASRFLLVDRFGVLPVFYADAAIGCVGGGWGTRGLHSVLEPAAAARPVIFGPNWQGSPDAGALLEARGAAALEGARFPDWLDLDPDSTLADANPLAAIWLALLRHPHHARAAGMRAREFVERGQGAAERNAKLVERLMDGE